MILETKISTSIFTEFCVPLSLEAQKYAERIVVRMAENSADHIRDACGRRLPIFWEGIAYPGSGNRKMFMDVGDDSVCEGRTA